MSAPFQPALPAVSVSATTTSAATSNGAWYQQPQVRIYNAGPDLIHVAWGRVALLPSGTMTATTTDLPVPAGAVEVFSKGAADLIAYRANSSTATVWFTFGGGE